MAEEDFELQEMELESLEVEGSIHKAKVGTNAASLAVNANSFQVERVEEEGDTPKLKVPNRASQALSKMIPEYRRPAGQATLPSPPPKESPLHSSPKI